MKNYKTKSRSYTYPRYSSNFNSQGPITHGQSQYSSTGYRYKKRRDYICCIKCGEEGHMWRNCTNPTTSFGIIAFRKRDAESTCGPLNEEHRSSFLCPRHAHSLPPDAVPQSIPSTDQSRFLFLMVQRKDTMGYIDFVRGAYDDTEPRKSELLRTYLNEMTCAERERLRSLPFEEIWSRMWVNKNSKCFYGDLPDARAKYNMLDVNALLNTTCCQWSQREWGFPKGRKMPYENDKQCALREFCEETGYAPNVIRWENVAPFREAFQGTNGKDYLHVYHLAEVPLHFGAPVFDTANLQQLGEVSNIAWFTYEQCMKLIRPYDVAKRRVLQQAYEWLTSKE